MNLTCVVLVAAHRDSTGSDDKLTVYVGEPATTVFLPISHPDGMDQIEVIRIGNFLGDLNLTNGTLGSDGFVLGQNPMLYQVKRRPGGGHPTFDEFEYKAGCERAGFSPNPRRNQSSTIKKNAIPKNAPTTPRLKYDMSETYD